MIKDLRAWKHFFENNKYLTNMELAQMASVSVKTIERRRAALKMPYKPTGWGSGLSKRPFAGMGLKLKKRKVKVVPREVWNCKEWMYEMYVTQGLGCYTIGRMINRDRALVRFKLIRFGIPTRSHKEAVRSTNPCCSLEWLEEHYETYGYTLEQCAELAGVNPYTICNWLVRYHIPIRDKYECMAGERSSA